MAGYNPTGYGPRASSTLQTSRFQRLCCDENCEKYNLWETKFFAYLTTKDEKLYNAVTAAPGKAIPADNSLVYAESVQLLDDKSLQLILNEAKNDANLAICILRKQYKSSETSRVISLYSDLTNLKMARSEDVTDYLIRAENIFTDLKNT